MKPLTIRTLHLNPPLILAPMAGITNRSFRRICRRFGASLCFTEMVSVQGLARGGKKTVAMLPSREEERPIGLQLFGSDPETLAEGARMGSPHADLIDINMGCPVRKVVSTGAGSALLRDPRRIADIVARVRAATSLPLTIKIRSGWSDDQRLFREIGRIAEGEGCDAITLHPRTRSQMFEGKAAWEEIAQLVATVRIPVIASGDIFTPEDAVAVVEQTGCAGVMVARGALGAPWIFDGVIASHRGLPWSLPNRRERGEIAREHYSLLRDEAGGIVAMREMKKHLSWYAKGLTGASTFRERVHRAGSEEEMGFLIESFFWGDE
ncbi:MAG: tRNA dihydrouridine synthase DusB [Desulfuromonadia bacterium]